MLGGANDLVNGGPMQYGRGAHNSLDQGKNKAVINTLLRGLGQVSNHVKGPNGGGGMSKFTKTAEIVQ